MIQNSILIQSLWYFWFLKLLTLTIGILFYLFWNVSLWKWPYLKFIVFRRWLAFIISLKQIVQFLPSILWETTILLRTTGRFLSSVSYLRWRFSRARYRISEFLALRWQTYSAWTPKSRTFIIKTRLYIHSRSCINRLYI